MKTGIIVYLAGEEPARGWKMPSADALGHENQVSAVEVITSASGEPDVHYAWWRLMCRGMARVICRLARFDRAGQVQLSDLELRLCG